MVINMVKAIILSCDNIKDRICIGCERCLTAARERKGEFEKFDKVEIVGIVSCGGCPGYIIPRLKLFNKWIDGFDDYDVIFIGKCIKTAVETGNCPLNLDKVVENIKKIIGKDVIIGTHPW